MKKRTSIAILLALTVALLLGGCLQKIENPAKVPRTNIEFQTMRYDGALSELEAAGFTNVTAEHRETDKEAIDGKVFSVSIDGKTDYKKNAMYESDVPVVITCYAYEAPPVPEPEPEPLEVMLEMETSGEDGKPVFVFRTNLPDDAMLSLEVITDDDFDFLYQEDLTVSGGEARSAAVTNDGEALNGIYSVGVALFPSEQPESVRAVIGEHGELMTGNRVEDMETYRYIAVPFEYVNVSYADVVEKVWAAMREGFGENFTMEYSESSIVVETWAEGIATNATLASLGGKENIDAWNGIVDSTQRACASVQDGIMTRCGYGDVDFTMILLNDANKDNHLLVVTSGYVLYDAVNGIDLISAAAG